MNALPPLSPQPSVRRVQRCVIGFKPVMLVCNQPNALEPSEQGEHVIDHKTKRITLKVSKDIDLIRQRLAADTGIEMTYNQIFNFLVHFYVERASEPKSKWKSLT